MARILVAALAVGRLAQRLSAAIVASTSVGPSGGLWSNASNWDPAQVPSNAGRELFDATVSPPVTVLVDSNPVIRTLTIGPGAVVDVSLPGQSLRIDGGSLSSDGTLEVAGKLFL